jgi:hypothetical protein
MEFCISGGGLKMDIIKDQVTGIVTSVKTTADECVRIAVDIDSSRVPSDVNLLGWKNNMVTVLRFPDYVKGES